MNYRFATLIACGATLIGAVTALAGSATAPVSMIPTSKVKWAGVPGVPPVSIAAVEGDPASGPSHFFLKYAAGFVTPKHHHSANHYVTTVSGNLILVAGGKEQRLPPGSFFALTNKAPHVARCESGADCVMFVDARSKWDLVPEPTPTPKP